MKFRNVREDSFYSLVVKYLPIEEGGPAHFISLTCDRCGANWNAKQYKVAQADNATNVAVNHRLECPGLNEG